MDPIELLVSPSRPLVDFDTQGSDRGQQEMMKCVKIQAISTS